MINKLNTNLLKSIDYIDNVIAESEFDVALSLANNYEKVNAILEYGDPTVVQEYAYIQEGVKEAFKSIGEFIANFFKNIAIRLGLGAGGIIGGFTISHKINKVRRGIQSAQKNAYKNLKKISKDPKNVHNDINSIVGGYTEVAADVALSAVGVLKFMGIGKNGTDGSALNQITEIATNIKNGDESGIAKATELIKTIGQKLTANKTENKTEEGAEATSTDTATDTTTASEEEAKGEEILDKICEDLTAMAESVAEVKAVESKSTPDESTAEETPAPEPAPAASEVVTKGAAVLKKVINDMTEILSKLPEESGYDKVDATSIKTMYDSVAANDEIKKINPFVVDAEGNVKGYRIPYINILNTTLNHIEKSSPKDAKTALYVIKSASTNIDRELNNITKNNKGLHSNAEASDNSLNAKLLNGEIGTKFDQWNENAEKLFTDKNSPDYENYKKSYTILRGKILKLIGYANDVSKAIEAVKAKLA